MAARPNTVHTHRSGSLRRLRGKPHAAATTSVRWQATNKPVAPSTRSATAPTLVEANTNPGVLANAQYQKSPNGTNVPAQTTPTSAAMPNTTTCNIADGSRIDACRADGSGVASAA